MLAEINFEKGNYQEVIDSATRAIQKNRQDGKAYFIRGRAYMELEDNQKAYEDLKLAQAYRPFIPEPNLWRGIALLKIGQPIEAYKWFNEVEARMQTDEQIAMWYFWRAMSLRELVSLEAAARDFSRVLEFPEGVVSPEMREEALKYYLGNLYAYTGADRHTFINTPRDSHANRRSHS